MKYCLEAKLIIQGACFFSAIFFAGKIIYDLPIWIKESTNYIQREAYAKVNKDALLLLGSLTGGLIFHPKRKDIQEYKHKVNKIV